MLPNDLFTDTAQTFRIHSEKRCNILHGGIVEDLGIFTHEFQISLFRTKRSQFFRPFFII